MPKRHAMSRGGSRRLFSKTASYTNKKNVSSGVKRVMRGGIRL